MTEFKTILHFLKKVVLNISDDRLQYNNRKPPSRYCGKPQ